MQFMKLCTIIFGHYGGPKMSMLLIECTSLKKIKKNLYILQLKHYPNPM